MVEAWVGGIDELKNSLISFVCICDNVELPYDDVFRRAKDLRYMYVYMRFD